VLPLVDLSHAYAQAGRRRAGIVAVLRAKITDQQHQISALRSENQWLQHELAIAHGTDQEHINRL
jgi:hypothetical protein